MKELVLNEPVIWLHDDLEPWASIQVGYNDNREFVVRMKYENPGDVEAVLRYNRDIVIGEKGVDVLEAKLHTGLLKLPETFAGEFRPYVTQANQTECESWSMKEVMDIYNEILNYLSVLNIRYRIEKTALQGESNRG